jgi:hypothetical protein
MIPVVALDELAAEGSTSLDLSAEVDAGRPLVVVDLDAAKSATPDAVSVAADAVRRSLPLVIGITTQAGHRSLDALIDALDLTLVPADLRGDGQQFVPVADPMAALAKMADAVSSTPRAAITLGQVLRQTEQLDVHAGLAAEAAAYSVLLAGREFKAWLRTRGEPRAQPKESGPVVDVDRRGDVLSVVLNRPERRNAVNAVVRDELVAALSIAIASPNLRVELSGCGANFSSGGDLDEFGSATDVDSAYLIRLDRHPGWLLHQLGDRALVKVHGACIGAGIEMPSLAHRVIATEDAYFALPEVAIGVIPGAGGTVGIPRRIGRWRTAWLALTGARIDAVTARDWGLVDDVVSA